MKKFIFLIAILISSCSTSSATFESSASSSTKSDEISQNENTIEDENLIEEPILLDITSRDLLSNPSFCRIDNVIDEPVRVAFPMSKSRLPSQGIINVQVMFIDFPDQIGTRNKEQLNTFFNDYIIGIEKFFDFQSGGKSKFNWHVEPGFIRIPENFSEYSLTRNGQFGSKTPDTLLRKAVAVSDDIIDYSEIDMIIVFLNPDIPESLADVSPAWPLEESWAIKTNEKTIYNATFIAGDAVRIGYEIIAHEIGHLFGLIDLYNYDWFISNSEKDFLRQFIFTGLFDFMNYAPKSYQYGDNRDMFGWQRWLLDWINDDEVNCLMADNPSNTTHLLSPVAVLGGNQRMIAIKISSTRLLVVEQRSKNIYCDLCSGGIYTYLIDSEIRSGYGAIKLIIPEHSKMELYQDAYLELDQLLMYENITIKVEQKQNDNTVVRIIID
jgi:M6 family metalloprotease-like protein